MIFSLCFHIPAPFSEIDSLKEPGETRKVQAESFRFDLTNSKWCRLVEPAKADEQ